MPKQTLAARVKSHLKSLRNSGAINLALLGETLAHFEAYGDSTPLAMLLAGVPDAYGKPLRAILRQVAPVTVRADATQPSGLRVAKTDKPQTDNEAATMSNKRRTLGALIAAKESTLGEAVAKAFLGKTDKPDLTLEQMIVGLFAKAISDGAAPDAILATAQGVARVARAQAKAHPDDAKAQAKALRAAYASKPEPAPEAPAKAPMVKAVATARKAPAKAA